MNRIPVFNRHAQGLAGSDFKKPYFLESAKIIDRLRDHGVDMGPPVPFIYLKRSGRRKNFLEHFLSNNPSHAILALSIVSLSVALSMYHLFLAYVGLVDAYSFRSTHLAFILVIAVLFKPLGRASWKDPYNWFSVIDFAIVALVVIIQVYILYDIDAYVFRGGNLNEWDIRLGTAMIFIVLEVTRRYVGMALVFIAGFFLLCC